MALTRNFLKSMGLTDEQVNAIIENHTDTVEALKKERDGYKAQADAAGEITKERDTLREQLSKAGDAAKVQAEFDAYKAGVAKKELNDRKYKALDAAFEKAGVKRDTFRRTMLKAWDLDAVELDDSGAIKDADGIASAVQKDYADFIATSEDKPLPPTNPPGGGHKYTAADLRKMTPEEINKNWDAIKGSLGDLN